MLTLTLLTLGSAWAADAKLRDGEIGLRLEAPFTASPNVQDQSLGLGQSQLHFGFEGEFAGAVNQRLYLLGRVGSRRQYLAFEDADYEPDQAFVESRSMRVLVGAQYSLLDAPTFVVLSASVGISSSYWVARVGAGSGDRKGWGPAGTLGLGVDHFVNPRFAITGELRGWGERQQAEQMSSGPYAFTSPSYRAGASLLVGIKFR
ncbi:MAG: hypothetical protein VX899_24000 [Myxococcota bacterium]|nr:hypothetical protein [Myxococcota bacterium]